jgi:D-glycero-D-manno-heptose 1,7-bisphosphate phosphatase
LHLQSTGFALAVATNQPGAAKGEITRAAIERTNAALVEKLAAHGVRLAAFHTCLHHPEGGDGGDPALVRCCDCRKPAPGMLVAIMAELGTTDAWMIGDTAHDIEAAASAHIHSGLLMRRGRCELCPFAAGEPYGVRPTVIAERLDELALLVTTWTAPT